MANQDAAFGLKPLGKIGGSPDNNAATEYEVAACASAFAQNDLLKEQHPGMPIDHDRQTRVTFGGTKKS